MENCAVPWCPYNFITEFRVMSKLKQVVHFSMTSQEHFFFSLTSAWYFQADQFCYSYSLSRGSKGGAKNRHYNGTCVCS